METRWEISATHGGQSQVVEAGVCLCAPSILKIFMLGARGSTLAADRSCDQPGVAEVRLEVALPL